MNKEPAPSGTWWVVPGKLLAGPYPADRYLEEQTRSKLSTLLDYGIDAFINLTGENEMPPYRKILEETAGWYDQPVQHFHFPVGDFGVPTPALMQSILETIHRLLAENKKIYLHCQAGIGRTGTVAGCFLAETGFPGQSALDELLRLRTLYQVNPRRAPETDEQSLFVKKWKK